MLLTCVYRCIWDCASKGVECRHQLLVIFSGGDRRLHHRWQLPEGVNAYNPYLLALDVYDTYRENHSRHWNEMLGEDRELYAFRTLYSYDHGLWMTHWYDEPLLEASDIHNTLNWAVPLSATGFDSWSTLSKNMPQCRQVVDPPQMAEEQSRMDAADVYARHLARKLISPAIWITTDCLLFCFRVSSDVLIRVYHDGGGIVQSRSELTLAFQSAAAVRTLMNRVPLQKPYARSALQFVQKTIEGTDKAELAAWLKSAPMEELQQAVKQNPSLLLGSGVSNRVYCPHSVSVANFLPVAVRGTAGIKWCDLYEDFHATLMQFEL